VKGKGTSSSSPRLCIIPDLVFGVIPYRRERGRLCAHKVAPFGALTALADITDKIEDLARRTVGELFHLFIDQFGNRQCAKHSPSAAGRKRTGGGKTVTEITTILDKGPHFGYTIPQRIFAHPKDASRVTPAGGARAVPAGGGSSLPLPGGSGDIRPAGTMTGLRGNSLDWDRKERVTPATKARDLSNHRDRALRPGPRKRVSGAELRRSLAAASAAVERRQASALASQRAPHPSMRSLD